ncbi:MAG TPA: enolase C-terminal domain-like protein [Acidobacteriaceae bacterium]|jgi:L-alanine-DL-glutamate epimerase-like enolase superfamily enzyme|nr:enolase C-terminal domain-like protein [Acidobacteriaceae bacterium]
MGNRSNSAAIEAVTVASYTIPTDAPESDGTLAWNHTTIVIAMVRAGGVQGLGYTYADTATAALIHDVLRGAVRGMDAMAPRAPYMAMWRAIRNLGRPGIASMGISAVDAAIWDAKARLLGVPLVRLLGAVRRGAAVYGSGGFTSYSDKRLEKQLSGWARAGMAAVKMKIGRDPARDAQRVRAARKAIGAETRLYVDANGAYTPRLALEQAEMLDQHDVRWFEEPVSSDDLEGMRFVRERAPARMRIAAGEYGYTGFDFQRMLAAGAVDVLQADMTRCGGVTGFLEAAALCEAWHVPLSSHTAPALHAAVACAAVPFTEMEYFHDHVRIETMLFEGGPQLVKGELQPDLSRPGNGLELRRVDAEKFAA